MCWSDNEAKSPRINRSQNVHFEKTNSNLTWDTVGFVQEETGELDSGLEREPRLFLLRVTLLPVAPRSVLSCSNVRW